jgi:hypothetical protein
LRRLKDLMLHSLIVIPFYFLGAMTLGGLLAVATRIFGLGLTIERIGGVAVFTSIAALTVLLVSGTVGIADLRIVPLVVLGLTSFALAAADALLAPGRPLGGEDGGHRHRTGDPQVL